MTQLGLLSGFQVFPEPVSLWTDFGGHDLLKSYYEATSDCKERELMRLQLYVACTLRDRNRDADSHLKSHPNEVVVLERGQDSGLYFLRAFKRILHPVDYLILERVIRTMNESSSDTLTIRLKARPEVMMDRIRRRARDGEEAVTKKYLEAIEEELDRMTERKKWHVIDTSDITPAQVASKILDIVLLYK